MPQAIFKDSIQLPTKDAAVLMTVISVSNTLQQGENFKYFVDLVNQEFKKGSLEKLIIVLTGYLQRHYFSLDSDRGLAQEVLEEQANELDKEWLDKNQCYVNKLQLPVEIKGWKSILELAPVSEFSDFYQKLKNHYQANKSFQKSVTKHVRKYVSRKISKYHNLTNQDELFSQFMQVGINYILEELAACVQLKKCGADFFTYPGAMNPPACYINKHFIEETRLNYIVYQVDELEEPNKLKNLSEVKRTPSPFFNSSISSNSSTGSNSSAKSLSKHYAQLSLKNTRWETPQEFQFIRGFEVLINSINDFSQSDYATKLTRRLSL